MPKRPQHPPTKPTTKKAAQPLAAGDPIFNQPAPSPDPTSFKNPVTDKKYQGLLIVEAVPQPNIAAVEPTLTLAEVYGSQGAAKTAAVKGPTTQSLVADKMVADFNETNPADVPSFFFHLGDLVYYFGESHYYYDEFFEPYRLYPAPILAIPGNHDGVVYSTDPEGSLAGFQRNFCATSFAQSPDAGGMPRSSASWASTQTSSKTLESSPTRTAPSRRSTRARWTSSPPRSSA
jgi:hypothetical protein